MDTFYTILEEPEVRAIWERIYEELAFEPSIRKHVPPFQLSAPYLILDLDYASEEQLDGLFGSGEGEEKLEGRVGIGAVPYYR